MATRRARPARLAATRPVQPARPALRLSERGEPPGPRHPWRALRACPRLTQRAPQLPTPVASCGPGSPRISALRLASSHGSSTACSPGRSEAEHRGTRVASKATPRTSCRTARRTGHASRGSWPAPQLSSTTSLRRWRGAVAHIPPLDPGSWRKHQGEAAPRTGTRTRSRRILQGGNRSVSARRPGEAPDGNPGDLYKAAGGGTEGRAR
jgi:hypothetical protein